MADYYHFVCRGQVSVKGKGQMLTYFLEGRSLQGGRSSQSQQHGERRSSAFNHGSVCTRLSPAPTVTTYATIRTPSPSLAKPTTSTSTTRYLPSVPTVMVWWMLSPWWPWKTRKWERLWGQRELIKRGKSRAVLHSSSTVCAAQSGWDTDRPMGGLDPESARLPRTLELSPPHSRPVCCFIRRGVVNRMQDALATLLYNHSKCLHDFRVKTASTQLY